MTQINRQTGSPQSQPAQAGTNGVLADVHGASRTGPLPKSALSSLLMRMDSPAADRNASNPPQATDVAATTDDPALVDDPNLTPAAVDAGTDAPDGAAVDDVNGDGGGAAVDGADGNANDGSTVAPGGEPQDGDGDGADGADGAQQDPTVQKHISDLAKLLKDQGLSIGEVKRIGKLLKDKGDLGSQVQELQRKIDELSTGGAGARPQPAAAADAGPFGHVTDEAGLRQVMRQMHEIQDFIDDNPDGGSFNGKEFSADEVRAMRKDVRKALELHIPERRQQIAMEGQVRQQQTQVTQAVRKIAPELYDPENPASQRMQQIIQQHPYVAQLPDRDYAAAAFALGDQILQQRLAKANSPATGAKGAGSTAGRMPAAQGRPQSGKPAVAVTSPGAVRRTQQQGPTVESLKQRAATDHSRSSLVELNSLRRRA
jgi:hypothetical protein